MSQEPGRGGIITIIKKEKDDAGTSAIGRLRKLYYLIIWQFQVEQKSSPRVHKMLRGLLGDTRVWMSVLSLSTRPRCPTQRLEETRWSAEGLHLKSPLGIVFIAGATGILGSFAATVGITALHGVLSGRRTRPFFGFRAYNYNFITLQYTQVLVKLPVSNNGTRRSKGSGFPCTRRRYGRRHADTEVSSVLRL